jgi:hypothetical protein
VFGFNGDAAQLAGLVPGEEENPPSPFRVPFEHPRTYVKAVGVVGIVFTTTL